MRVTPEQVTTWCRYVLGAVPEVTHRPLPEYLAAIPRLESLDDVPKGTTVLVRGDLDCKPGPQVGDGDVRLRSMLQTLQYGRQRRWKQILFGHLGREPDKSLSKVRQRLQELLQAPVELVGDWLDEDKPAVRPALRDAIRSCPPGGFILLENTRRYAIERLLWKLKPDEVSAHAARLAALVNEISEQVARVYVNEALSAGSLDTSTTVLPSGMDRVALGAYVAQEFCGPMLRCLDASLVVFSGLKIDKLDDLQAIVDRGRVRYVIAAGSLAMALKKADAELAGNTFCLGKAEDPKQQGQPYFIPPERIAQARHMLAHGRKAGVRFVLPIDFVLQDGRVSERIGPDDQQFDVGPQTRDLFARTLDEYLEALRSDARLAPVVFHNGVFGRFEDPQFAEGTKHFIQQLMRLHAAGVEVYVGGGEGGTALEWFGRPDGVTHCFTAGGTVLNALGGQPVPYLVALRLAAQRDWGR
jgi:phosphoglycerate kinase